MTHNVRWVRKILMTPHLDRVALPKDQKLAHARNRDGVLEVELILGSNFEGSRRHQVHIYHRLGQLFEVAPGQLLGLLPKDLSLELPQIILQRRCIWHQRLKPRFVVFQ